MPWTSIRVRHPGRQRLAEALERLEDPDEHKRVSKIMRERARQQSWPVVMERLESVLESSAQSAAKVLVVSAPTETAGGRDDVHEQSGGRYARRVDRQH